MHWALHVYIDHYMIPRMKFRMSSWLPIFLFILLSWLVSTFTISMFIIISITSQYIEIQICDLKRKLSLVYSSNTYAKWKKQANDHDVHRTLERCCALLTMVKSIYSLFIYRNTYSFEHQRNTYRKLLVGRFLLHTFTLTSFSWMTTEREMLHAPALRIIATKIS